MGPFQLRAFSLSLVLHAVTLLTLTTALCSNNARAQEPPEHRWTANGAVGFTPLVGAINQRLDNGWHVSFGAGYNFSSRFSLAGQFMYNGLGVSRGVLHEFAVPDGNAKVWSLTAEPRINIAPRRKFTPYFTGGVGYYRRSVQFTQPALAQEVVFDPFFGFFPVTVRVNQVLGTFARDGIGGSAGLGFDVPIHGESGPKLFTEVRFHYSDAGGIR
jgi:opacity protein-like surface antigen